MQVLVNHETFENFVCEVIYNDYKPQQCLPAGKFKAICRFFEGLMDSGEQFNFEIMVKDESLLDTLCDHIVNLYVKRYGYDEYGMKKMYFEGRKEKRNVEVGNGLFDFYFSNRWEVRMYPEFIV